MQQCCVYNCVMVKRYHLIKERCFDYNREFFCSILLFRHRRNQPPGTHQTYEVIFNVTNNAENFTLVKHGLSSLFNKAKNEGNFFTL